MLTQTQNRQPLHAPHSEVAIVLTNSEAGSSESERVLARVGTLPVVLRAILGAQTAHPRRIIVVVDLVDGPRIRQELLRTGRLPNCVEFVEAEPGSTLSPVLREAALDAERVVVIMGDRTYHPSLHRMLTEWDGRGLVLELKTGEKPVGLFALASDMALDLAANSDCKISSMADLHRLIAREAEFCEPALVRFREVPADLWQRIEHSWDPILAERKLDRWLTKPTDGIFARMNRRVSVPISRQMIKFPITPNMVTLFTLGVSIASGVFFALGGYWNTLLAAVLSVWASILDGCDGEVARLKLQVSDFGCWLETVCDYLYYLFIFAGMAIGLARSTGKSSYLAWGGTLLAGAVLTFIIAGLGRQRLSGAHPEQFLAVWQERAEMRLSNPLVYIGRHTEFIVRRCFLPYALLAFAVLNLTNLVVFVGAIGANVAWIVSLYSYFAFSPTQQSAPPISVASTTVRKPLIA